jgi:alkylation response protein AidB-like acyl-CoA dehydrogenase
MSVNSFITDLRDIRFVLHEQLGVSEALADIEQYEDFDKDFFDSIIDAAHEVCGEVLWPINASGDQEGCHFDGKGNVTTPAGFKEAYTLCAENGYCGLTSDEDYGGMGMPHVIGCVVSELFTSANPSFSMYPGLSHAAANLLAEFFREDLRTLVCTKMFSGEWCGTMCLTEPGAGTSVGDNRTKAVPTDKPGVYRLTGEKIFISGGDHDLTDNIIHLVLARTPGAPNGTRGLSIFAVPKFFFDEEGNIGERNGIFVTGIEEKMGIHASSTCSLALGANQTCEGFLIGEEFQGMRIMFHMMNQARLEVGIQGLAGAAVAYNQSLAYAKDRIQGSPVEAKMDPDAEPVTINQHPDVRRMLMWQKVHVETMRSFIFTVGLQIDQMEHIKDPVQRRELKGQVELMTPIIKSYCTDRGYESTVIGLQCFGGYGYTGEYCVEQVVRDTKIASIYEGTNGVQAMDLLGRKMAKAQGALFMTWMNGINTDIERARVHEELAGDIAAIEKARDSLGASAMHLGGLGMQGEIRGAMLHASPFLDQFGNVVLAQQALIQARIALEKLPDATGGDVAHLKGKILGCHFYCAHVLPHSMALGKSIRGGDTSCLDEVLFS